MAEPVAERLSFPTDPTLFDADERISFSRQENKFVAVQTDGTEFEFDSRLKRWVPVVDDELVRAHQAAYVPAGYVEVPEDTSNGADKRNNRKRKKAAGDQEVRNIYGGAISTVMELLRPRPWPSCHGAALCFAT